MTDGPVGERDASLPDAATDAAPGDGATLPDAMVPDGLPPDAPPVDQGPTPDASLPDAAGDGPGPDMGPCTGVVCDTPPACRTLPGVCIDGQCSYDPDPLADGSDCDDGDDCTFEDVCAGGICAGSPADGDTVASPNESVHFAATTDPDGTAHVFYTAASVDLVHVHRAPGGPWVSENVPIPVNAAFHMVATASGAGALHVVYHDNDGLTYGRYETDWSFETIELDTSGFLPARQTGWYPSIAVDALGDVHVAYGRLVMGCPVLVHAERLGVDTWTTEVVDDNGCAGLEPAIAAHNDGSVHIAYVNATTRQLMYAERPPVGPWSVERVADVGELVQGPALVLDAGGDAHVAFEMAARQRDRYLRYGRRGPTGWTFESIDGEDAHGPSIGLDQDGSVWVSYLREQGRSIRLANRGLDGRWRIQTIEESTVFAFPRSLTGETALALSAGVAHVIYDWRFQWGEPFIHDAKRPIGCDGACEGIPCGPAATPCEAPEACVDGLCVPVEAEGAACDDGNPCTEDFCAAGTCVGRTPWTAEVADIEGRWHPAAVVDDLGGLHVVSQDLQHYRLRYAHLPAGGAWSAETVDSDPLWACIQGGTGHGPSLAVGNDGTVHIGYAREIYSCGIDPQSSEIRYAHRAVPGPWTIDVVDSASLRTETALALDTDGSSVHILYVGSCPTVGLCHSENTGGSFVANGIEDEVATPIFSPSLAVDSAGSLHAAYLHPMDTLRYANKPTAGAWAASTVTATSLSRSLIYRQVTLALDAADEPHIAVPTDCGVVEAHGDGGAGWTATDVIVDCASWNSTPALAMDAAGTHRLALLGDYGQGHRLVFAEQPPAGAWSVEQMPEALTGLEGSALVLDGSGGVHLFFSREALSHVSIPPCP